MQAETLAATPATPRRLPALPRSAGLLLTRCLAMGLQFLSQLAVASVAGPAGVGVLQLFQSWSSILGECLAQGLPAKLLRQGSVLTARGEGYLLTLKQNAARRRILNLWVWLSLALLLLLPLLGDREPALVLIIAIVAIGAPLFALMRLNAEVLKSRDRASTAVWLESMLPPLGILAGCATWLLLDQRAGLMLVLSGAIIGLAPGALLHIVGASPPPSAGRASTGEVPRVGQREQRALWLQGLLAIVFTNLPFLLLPLYVAASEIGTFSIASRLFAVATTLLILLASLFGPAFARAHARGDIRELERLLRRSQCLSLALFLPFAASLALLAPYLAEWFKLPPDALKTYLLLLGAGQVINAATGLPGVLLAMTGQARVETRILATCTVAALVAGLVVGPLFGGSGIAVLFSVALALKNLGSLFVARQQIQDGDSSR